MSKFVLLVCIFAWGFMQCAADLRQVPPPSPFSELAPSKSKIPVAIGTFEIFNAERTGVYLDAWRLAFRHHMVSFRVFSKSLQDSETNPPKDFYLLDVELYPKLEEGYNWWVSFPAILPFLGYWPIQHRQSLYSVELKYKLSKGTQKIKEGSIQKEGKAESFFYGFYRVGPIERRVEEVNFSAIEECAKQLSESL